MFIKCLLWFLGAGETLVNREIPVYIWVGEQTVDMIDKRSTQQGVLCIMKDKPGRALGVPRG